MIKGFGLRHKKTGELARLCFTSNEGRDNCNEFTCQLIESSEGNIYITSFQSVLSTVIESTPWYNSDEHRPNWENYYFSMHAHEIVSIVVPNPIVTSVSYEIPASIDDFYEGDSCFVDYEGDYAFVGILKTVPDSGTVLYCSSRGFVEVIRNVEKPEQNRSFLVVRDISFSKSIASDEDRV